MWDRIGLWLATFGAQVLGAAVTLIIGYLVARFVRRLVKKLLKRTELATVLQNFVGRIV